MTILALVISVTTYSQTKSTELADQYFNCEQYQSALTKYQKSLKKNRFWHRVYNYEYFYILFQISESKRLLNDSTCEDAYQDIIDKYWTIALRDIQKLDKRVLLFVAESEKNTQNFSHAENYYKQASNSIDSLPDFFKLGYAFCSIKENRYGQALMLLGEIKDSETLEPQFSQYLSTCKMKLSQSITKNIGLYDTLNLTMNYRGCHGGISYKFGVIKHPDDYKVISYKSRNARESTVWEIDGIKTVTDSVYSLIIDFEDELKNYNQYTSNASCTLWADFLIETKKDYYKIVIDDCAIGVGHDIKSILDKKL